MELAAFHHADTSTWTYVVFDPRSKDAVILDPVLDYDPGARRVGRTAVDALLAFVDAEGLAVRLLLETHVHADHLTAAQVLKARFPGAPVTIGAGIVEVRRTFAHLLTAPGERDRMPFDRLVRDGERLAAGRLEIGVLATPGHTPACVTYRIGEHLFTGDALFLPDRGTGRVDFPGGSAAALYRSVHGRLYALPGALRVHPAHDAPGTRGPASEASLDAERAGNVMLRADTSEAEFVARRQARDAGLAPPRLLTESLAVNLRAGRLPSSLDPSVRSHQG